MNKEKQKAICELVDISIKSFVQGLETRYEAEVNLPDGVINAKKNNCFINELGEEFMFFSAFVRSFDSSFGKVLENMGNSIAKLSYEVRNDIESFLLPQQSQHMDYLMAEYEKHVKPRVTDYSQFTCVMPQNIQSYQKNHKTDNYFYNPNTREHFVIELKAGGDLDNKKAKAEKIALLQEYFLLKNKLKNSPEDKVHIFFATAYNKFGEENVWKQANVQTFFADEELLIGKNYWNFVCDDKDGFEIIFTQYKQSANIIKNALVNIKSMYFAGGVHA